VWIASVCLGLSMAPIFPTTFAYVEANMDLNATFAAVIVIGAAVGDIGLPILMAEIMAAYTLEAFPALVMSFGLTCTVGLVISVIFARCLHRGTRFGSTGRDDKEKLRELELTPSQRRARVGSLTPSPTPRSDTDTKTNDPKQDEKKNEAEAEEREPQPPSTSSPVLEDYSFSGRDDDSDSFFSMQSDEN
jgi:hypothetical protein